MLAFKIHFVIVVLLYSGFVTALASAVHGRDGLSKGEVMFMHFFLLPTVAPAFWYFFRRSWQARAELDYIDGLSPIDNVRKAYPFGLGRIVAPIIEYVQNNPWVEFGVRPIRRQQELCTGFVLGILLAVFFLAPFVIFVN